MTRIFATNPGGATGAGGAVEGETDVGAVTVGVAGSGGANVVDVAEVDATEAGVVLVAAAAVDEVLEAEVAVTEVEVTESVVEIEVGDADMVEVGDADMVEVGGWADRVSAEPAQPESTAAPSRSSPTLRAPRWRLEPDRRPR